MAKYDSKGVPILSFHNPAGMILYPAGLYTYAMGNTRARELTEFLGTSSEQHLDLLLLACGDVRNILYTVSELSLRKSHERPRSLNFHLNDYDPTVIARNAVLLEAAGVIDPDIPADIDFLWNVWYNLALSKSHFDRLQEILSELLERDFDSHESVLKFQNNTILQECRDIWKDWLGLDLEVNSVKEDRNISLEEKRQQYNFSLDMQCMLVLTQMMMAFNDYKEAALMLPTATNRFYTEIKHWFCEGSTSDDSEKTNPTLIRPFIHKWKLHYSSCAFESYLPFEREDLERCKTLTAACKDNLSLMVKRFQQQKNEYLETLKITLWTGDGLSLCTSGFPPDLLFDVIDTSNVSDHIGLLNVLVCCSPRLKVPNSSLLLTSSMLWSNACKNIEEYYFKSVGVPVQLLPTVLGLKLAIDLDLGSNKLPDRMELTEEILCWVKADSTRTMLTIDKNSDVLQALHRLVERCFNLLNYHTDQVSGVTLSSPITFLRIIHQIQPIIKGGATQIFDLLESGLPADFIKKYGLSWNLLKASVGNGREPIVEIKARINISIASWYKGTPIPMVCIAEQSDFEKEQLHRLFGLPASAKPTFSAIYNSLRYDVDAHTVTFHLREKDWNKLKSNSWMWLSSSYLIPVLICEDVRLGDEIVESVARVDPVEKFGLFSVQNFTATGFNENNQVIKLLKVEESTSSYHAELEILDLATCKAKAMKVTFQPEKCPTRVQIRFNGARGGPFNMYFSCPVDETSSKFQISRTRGKVLCDIPKREDGTVGELVLQNPAPVPFHALTLWDTRLHNIQICTKMFRTELDVELKQRDARGSPFFNLRDTIFIILKHHVDKPEHFFPPTAPLVYCLDERGVIEEPYQTPENMSRKKGLVIVVQQLYKWRYLPVAKVLFCDCQRFADRLRNESASTQMQLMRSFWSASWLHLVDRIVADQPEKSLLRKMLYTNAARVPQESESDVWKNSFITLLFPREKSFDLAGAAGKFTANMKDFPFFSPESSQSEEDFSSGSFVELLKDLLQHQMGPSDTGLDHESFFDPPRWAAPLREPECAFCRSKTQRLKRCSGCKRVFYCSKTCQRNHWKEHKAECQKS